MCLCIIVCGFMMLLMVLFVMVDLVLNVNFCVIVFLRLVSIFFFDFVGVWQVGVFVVQVQVEVFDVLWVEGLVVMNVGEVW